MWVDNPKIKQVFVNTYNNLAFKEIQQLGKKDFIKKSKIKLYKRMSRAIRERKLARKAYENQQPSTMFQ